MRKIEHIGIAVNDLQEANRLYALLLGKSHYKIEEVLSEKVKTSFFQVGESKVELLQSLDGTGPIASFLEKRGPGMHHIAFAVDDIRSEMKRLTDLGFQLTSSEPKVGADNKLVCFVHPRTTSGVLVELCQDISSVTDESE